MISRYFVCFFSVSIKLDFYKLFLLSRRLKKDPFYYRERSRYVGVDSNSIIIACNVTQQCITHYEMEKAKREKEHGSVDQKVETRSAARIRRKKEITQRARARGYL